MLPELMAIFEMALKCSALLSLAKILHIIRCHLEPVQDRRSVTVND